MGQFKMIYFHYFCTFIFQPMSLLPSSTTKNNQNCTFVLVLRRPKSASTHRMEVPRATIFTLASLGTNGGLRNFHSARESGGQPPCIPWQWRFFTKKKFNIICSNLSPTPLNYLLIECEMQQTLFY